MLLLVLNQSDLSFELEARASAFVNTRNDSRPAKTTQLMVPVNVAIAEAGPLGDKTLVEIRGGELKAVFF